MMSKAIIRNISRKYLQCISSHPLHHELRLKKAIEQHKSYVIELKNLGLEIIEIQAEDLYPDCCFIEDTAIIHNKKAIITRMGIESRRGEIEATKTILKDYFNLKLIENEGIIEGGDVLHFKNELISGITQRTNKEGIRQCKKWLGTNFKTISDPNIVHLKSYISKLDEKTLICTDKYSKDPVLNLYEKIIVPKSEIYAANVLEVNGTIIMGKKFPKTKILLKENNFDVVELNTSEFQKCDGALTCLSIIF